MEFRSTENTERTVKKLRLSKALTIPEGTLVSDACRRMAARRVDAVLLTDSNALLSGIVTDKVFICLFICLFVYLFQSTNFQVLEAFAFNIELVFWLSWFLWVYQGCRGRFQPL